MAFLALFLGGWERHFRFHFLGKSVFSIKRLMGPYQRTPKEVAIELLDTQV